MIVTKKGKEPIIPEEVWARNVQIILKYMKNGTVTKKPKRRSASGSRP